MDGVVGQKQPTTGATVRRQVPWKPGCFVGREDAPSVGRDGRMHRRRESSYGGDLRRGDVNFGGFKLLLDGSLAG